MNQAVADMLAAVLWTASIQELDVEVVTPGNLGYECRVPTSRLLGELRAHELDQELVLSLAEGVVSGAVPLEIDDFIIVVTKPFDRYLLMVRKTAPTAAAIEVVSVGEGATFAPDHKLLVAPFS